jgi:hypothetical protein
MITIQNLIRLGFVHRQLDDGEIYCLNDFCLTHNAAGWSPTNLNNDNPKFTLEVIDTIEELRMYYTKITSQQLPE